MRLQHVFQRVYGEPWQITPAGWYAIHQIVMSHHKDAIQAAMPEGKRPAKTLFGEQLDQLEISGGVARIPIKGALVKGAGMLEKSCGACSHEDIHADLDEALRAKVETIVLDINSPGGMVTGTREVSERVSEIARSSVRVVAYTEDLMCSAAYSIAAGANQIFATPSSTVGSVGTIWEFYNVAAALEKEGVQFDIFTSGPFKGTGHPARQLSPAQREWIQNHVDSQAAIFKAHVSKHRPGVRAEAMQGQVFTGANALRAGLVDGNPRAIKEALSLKRTASVQTISNAPRELTGMARIQANIRAQFQKSKTVYGHPQN